MAGSLSPNVREAVVRVVGADDFDVKLLDQGRVLGAGVELTSAGSLSPSEREGVVFRVVGADDFDGKLLDRGRVVGAGVEVVGCARL